MEKILIGEKQYIGKQNVDNFIDIDIQRTIETIKVDSFENKFDFQKHYDTERNESLKFCLYGMIESRFSHCDNLLINIIIGDSQSGGTVSNSIYSPLKSSIITSANSISIVSRPLNAHSDINLNLSKNIYGAKKGYYYALFELDKDEVFAAKKTLSAFIEIFDTIREIYCNLNVPIVYFNQDNELIEFGTENAEINDDNEIVEINNNFPFFYDRHWVKTNIEPFGPPTIFFTSESFTISETIPSTDIQVSLSEPSKNGLEKARIVIDFGWDYLGNKISTAEIGLNFNFIEPVLNWSQGEQIKTFTINIINDLIVQTTLRSIVFRILPLSNVRINPSEQYKHTLLIESEDVPSRANFTNSLLIYERPNPLVNSVDLHLIDINLSSPVTIENQKIKVKILTGNTTALIATHFYLDQNNQFNKDITEIILDVPLSATNVQLKLYVQANNMYDLDREILFQLEQETSNVTVGNTITQLKIVLKDGMLDKFVQYILPIDTEKGTSVYKTIYNAPSFLNSITILEEAQPNPAIDFKINQTNVTRVFTCKLRIKNVGSTARWNNVLFHNEAVLDIPLDFSQLTSDVIFDLPANHIPDYQNKTFLNCRYEFSFIEISKFYPISTPQKWKETVDTANDFTTTIQTDDFSAGNKGDVRRYLVSKIEKVKTQFDADSNTCLTIPAFKNQLVQFNGGLLVPKKPDFGVYYSADYTKVTMYFNDKIVKDDCAKKNNVILPVGTDFVPAPPFNEKYANLNLGGIFVQDGYSISSSGKMMKMGATMINGMSSTYDSFKNWTGTDVDTKSSIGLKITNKGCRDVMVLSKEIAINASKTYNLNDVNFENLSIILPTNDVYDINTNSFVATKYVIEIINVKIYNGTTYSLVALNKTLPTFLAYGNDIQYLPTYYYLTRYNGVKLAANSFGNLDCSVNILTAANTVVKNIYVNDLLFFANKGTVQGIGLFTTTPISPSCLTSLMKYEIVI